jgi:hypothetical protein
MMGHYGFHPRSHPKRDYFKSLNGKLQVPVLFVLCSVHLPCTDQGMVSGTHLVSCD